jgi:hypothetical protein
MLTVITGTTETLVAALPTAPI